MNFIDVLIVDDNKGILWIFDELLGQENIRYKLVQSGIDGLKLINKYKPGLVITDFKLGGPVNGIDLIRKSVDCSIGSNFIIMTGYSKQLQSHGLDSLPIVNILEKPFDIVELLSIIKSEIKSSEQQIDIIKEYPIIDQ